MRVVIDLRPPRGRIAVTPSWTISAMEKAKAIPGRKRFVDKVMHFELDHANIGHVLSAFPQAEVIRGEEETSRKLKSKPRPPFATRLAPTALQTEAFGKARGKRLFAFFEKPGAGKTKMILDWAVDLWCSGEIDGLFVLSFATVHEQWVMDEIPEQVHPSIPVEAAFWRGSGRKQNEAVLEPDGNKFRVLTMNYEAYATSTKAFSYAKQFALSGQMAAALDESQRIKTPDSQIALKAVENRNDWYARCIASGEPTPLGVEDYYQQFAFLDPGIIGAWTYEAYKSMFCRLGGFQNTKIVGYQNQEHLHRLMAPHVHVGAPDIKARQIFEVSRFELGPAAREAYDQMLDELRVEVNGENFLSVRSVLPKLTKLAEIACGRLTNREGEVIHFGSERMDLLKSILGKYPSQKAIVWSRFVADHAQQAQMLGSKSAVFNGSTSEADRRVIKERFLDPNDDLQYMLASVGAAGTGLNLQGSCFLNVYYSNSFNAGQRWQSERRTYRLGTPRDVLYIDMLARRTVDIPVLNSLRRKREISDMSIEEFRNLMNEDAIWEPND